jgi:aryl-alcohol dehydrogenase-like predicted oxidoreductase
MAYARDKKIDGIALSSPSLSLARVTESRWEGVVYADNDSIRWHERTQLPLFSWAAQASGFFHFAGKYKREDFPNPDIARTYYNDDNNMERLKRLQELATSKGEALKPRI